MLAGFTCPSHGAEPGRNNEVDHCLRECVNPCVAPHVLAAMLEDEQDNPHKGTRISVTMLTGGCKRATMLERNLPFWVEPNRKLPTFRGTMIHTVAERAAPRMREEYGWLIEEHMTMPITSASGEWMLSGTLDAYDVNRRILYDIKTLQDYAVKMTVLGKQNGVWSDHISDAYVKQLNIYRYMLDRCLDMHPKRLVLQVIGFGQFLTTGHDNQVVALQKGYKFSREPYDLPDVPIVEDEMVEKWIEREGDEWYRIMNDDEQPQVAPDDYKWLCKFCSFNGSEHCPDPDKERSHSSE